MDPWNGAEHQKLDSVDSDQVFADNFDNNSSLTETGDKVSFERLPDSEEYIKLLENKLNRIKGSKSNQKSFKEESKAVRQRLVDDLARVREETLANFVTNCDSENGEGEEDIDSERSVSVNPVLRRLVPEQPITAGEQLSLTKADKLSNQSEASSESPDSVNTEAEKTL